MKRVLHIIGKMDLAGAETMVMNLYRTIDRKQIQFDFVVFTKDKGDFDDEILSLGGKIFSLIESNPIKRMLALKHLLLSHPDYQVVQSHTLYSSAFHLLAAKMAKVSYRIVHSHTTCAVTKSKLIDVIYPFIARKIINKCATHFIGCGQAAANFLFPNQKEVLLLPNSIDIRSFAEIGEKECDYLNNEFNLDNSYLKIIQVGRLQTVKNHLFSVQIAKELKNNGTPFRMFFVGQGDLYEDIQKEIEIHNLENEVILLGVRTDIPQLMAGADLMLMPSFHEGFPVVLVESQSVGLPALISGRISQEVDLGVDLIEFASLEDRLDVWVKNIKKLTGKRRLNCEERLSIISSKGYDVKINVKNLEQLYSY